MDNTLPAILQKIGKKGYYLFFVFIALLTSTVSLSAQCAPCFGSGSTVASAFISFENPVEVNCNADTSLSLAHLNGVFQINITDCDSTITIDTLTLSQSGTCPQQIIRRWIAEDACGNRDSINQIIRFRDTFPPIFTDTTADADLITLDTSVAILGTAIAIDNSCNPDLAVTVSYEDFVFTSGICPIEITRRWYAEDLCGNIDSTDQLIRITETNAPQISLDAASGFSRIDTVMVACDSMSSVVPSTFGLSISDDTDPLPSISTSDNMLSGTCQDTILRTWTVTDGCSNAANFNQVILFIDTVVPQFTTIPLDTIVNCDVDTSTTNLGTAVASDNCTATNNITSYYEDVSSTGTCPVVVTRRWYAVDECMNIDSTDQTISIQDTIAPILSCPTAISTSGASTDVVATVATFAYSETDATIDTAQYRTVGGSITEACSISSMYYFDSMTGSCPIVVTRTFVAVDGCSNRDSCTQTITISSTPSPRLAFDTCSTDLSTYSLFVFVNSNDTISVDTGTVTMVGVDTFLISGVPDDSTVNIVVTNTIMSCTKDTMFTHNCDCPTIPMPVSNGDTSICVADTIPPLTVSVESGLIVNWYDAIQDTLVASNDTSYTPTIAGTFGAVAVDTVSKCISDTTDVVLTIVSPPTISFMDTVCNTNGDTLSVRIQVLDGVSDTVGVSRGTLSSVGTGVFVISNIPDDSSVVITVVDTMAGCATTQTYTFDCECLTVLNAPSVAVDTFIICPGDSTVMTVGVDSTETADWYNSSGTAVLIGDTSYVALDSGFYNIVTRDTVRGCVSTDSARILLQFHPTPTTTILNNQSPYCLPDTVRLIGDTVAHVTYAWSSNQSAIFNDTSLQAPTIYNITDDEIFTLVIRDTLTGCSSRMILDTIMVDTFATISSIAPICDADLLSYSVQIFSNASSITIRSRHGAVAPGSNPYTIVGIPVDSTILLNLELDNGCNFDTLITSPTCDCPMVNPPTTDNDMVAYCANDSLPTLTAQVDSSETVDWFDNAAGTGTALLVGSITYTPTAVGTYYALTRDTINGCISSTTTAIEVTENPLPNVSAIASLDICEGDSVTLIAMQGANLPSLEWGTTGMGQISNASTTMAMAGSVADGDRFILQGTDDNGCTATDTTNAVMVMPIPVFDTIYTQCTPDLQGYNTFVVASNGILEASAGSVSSISADTFQVLNIPVSTNLTLTFTDQTSQCQNTRTIPAPNCNCPATLPPPTVNDLTICKEETPLLQAMVGAGETVNWFDTIIGGTPITVNPNFVSPETTEGTYIYYAQTVNASNGCVSNPRTPVTLTILPLPNPNLTPVVSVCPETTTTLTPGLFSSYFWSTGETTATVDVGAGQYFVTVTDANGCTTVAVTTVEEDEGQMVSLSIPDMACTTDPLLSLTGGNPSGGVYSGTGISNGVFDPAVAGAGVHTITYTVSGSCMGVATAQIEVLAPENVNFSIPNDTYCTSDASITLSGGSPEGGIYSGSGVDGGIFDPSLAGVGTHSIIYTVGTGTSCVAMDSTSVTVIAMPDVSFTPPNAIPLNICDLNTPITLAGGSPMGGMYVGTGVSNGIFNPAIAGVGAHIVSYVFSTETCRDSAMVTFIVMDLPNVSLSLSTDQVCDNGGSITLSGGSPAGGTYTGMGVTNSTFDPSGLATGNYTITYNYDVGGGCIGSASDIISVISSGQVDFNLNFSQVCENSGLTTLSGGSPVGGTYSGPGVVGNTFNPITAGIGTHTITYTGNSDVCFGTAFTTITVFPADEDVSLNLNAPALCSNSSTIPLIGGSPEGGTYTGTGVMDGRFDPSIAGSGTHTISYITACGSASDQIEVSAALPVNLALTRNAACTNEAAIVLSGGSPDGGTYSGEGVSENLFNPSALAPGTYTITYTVNPMSGCSGSATGTITVAEPTNISTSFNLNATDLCTSSSAFVLSGGSPTGGVYSGQGVVDGSTFDPAIAGVGTHTLTYSINGCSSGSSTATITVTSAPPIPELRMASAICIGEDLQLEATTIPNTTSYEWSGPNGFTSSLPNPVIPNTTTLNEGRYNLIIRVGNCASAMSSIDVAISSLPDPVSVSNSGAVCQGSDFTIQVDNSIDTDLYNWFYQNGSFIGTGSTLILNSNNNPAGRYYATISRGGCTYNPIEDTSAPSFAFTDVVISEETAVGAFAGQDVSVCENTFNLNPTLPNNPNIFGTWSTLAGSQAIIADPNQFNSPVFDLESGNNVFVWTLSNQGCVGLSTDTLVVNYVAPPVLVEDNFTTLFSESLTVDVLANDELNNGSYFIDSVFSSANGTRVINGDQTISYTPANTFVGTDQLTYRVCSNFCPDVCATASFTIDVMVNTNAADITLPNTITPNGDGMNDALIIPEVLQYPGSELIIFNRWGDEVFRSNDYQNDWDGFWEENRGELPIGTYFYVLTLNDTARTRMVGYVYIQRD